MSDSVELDGDLAKVAEAKATALGVDLGDVVDGLLRAWVGKDLDPDYGGTASEASE